MAERVMPRDAQTQITTIPNKTNSLKLVYNDATDTNDSISVEDDIAEYQAGDGVNTTYRTRTKTKVLWTGPLSVVSTPTSLDVGEKFSDWDLIEVDMSLDSDVATGIKTPFVQTEATLTFLKGLNSGVLVFEKISDTTFQISSKTVAAGNIQRIIGVSL